MNAIARWMVPGIALWGALGCGDRGAGGGAGGRAGGALPPSKVSPPSAEGGAAVVALSPEAESRLGIATAVVEKKSVERRRTLGGFVEPRPGGRIAVAAPLAGAIAAPESGEVPLAGASVARGQVLLRFVPALGPDARARLAESRAQAEGDTGAAKVELEAARLALDRAEKLLEDRAVSVRAVEEARARVRSAEVALATAQSRERTVEATLAATGESVAAVSVEAPIDGTLEAVPVAPGQQVAAGASLFTVVDLSRPWVRVPVRSADLASIDRGREARISRPGAGHAAEGVAARPVAGPPTADPIGTTVDLRYEAGPLDPPLVPGESVDVSVPLTGDAESLVVPWKAVLHDAQGGAWVFEALGDHRYARRRTDVRYVVGDLAVLAAGPAPGASVVTDGAAELLGVETGFAK